jgi:hypothetical protein
MISYIGTLFKVRFIQEPDLLGFGLDRFHCISFDNKD